MRSGNLRHKGRHQSQNAERVFTGVCRETGKTLGPEPERGKKGPVEEGGAVRKAGGHEGREPTKRRPTAEQVSESKDSQRRNNKGNSQRRKEHKSISD